MRPYALIPLMLAALTLAGCKNNTQTASARQEEPYTPSHTTLDQMDADPTSDPIMTYDPAPGTDSQTTSATESYDEPLTPVGGRTYTVQKGDTLYALARRFYSDQARWRDIWEANRNRLSNPDRLPLGTKLIIP